ncbi:MAG: Gfo/Idh/MocA family oxidoreductase [Planctomycetia bacterium]|nr:Gfo/Idh/MocA family oxidoreductase [Planctomycetia bacterium]
MKNMNRRSFLTVGAVGAAALSLPGIITHGSEKTVRLGFIGVGGRGFLLSKYIKDVPNAKITAVCDPDSDRLARAQKAYPDAKGYSDMRLLFEDKNVDAVVIATCNHWHCLAAIWAMQAGKDVYVEKPFCMSFWEGQQVLNAVQKYDRLCQLGTQMRTDPVFHPEVKKFLHEDKALGEIHSVRINRFCARKPIGLRTEPLEIPKTVDYNLWLGPAKDRPLYRNQLQYDWHWMWYTGHGETGNWGAHLIDDCRNDILCDKVRMPKRVLSGGGRLGYNDAGESPNSMFVYFDTGTIPIVFCISNLPDRKNRRSAGTHPGPDHGYIAYCEGGRYEKYWGGANAYDREGKLIREFKGTSEEAGGVFHLRNFVNAVIAHDRSMLSAPITVGFDSASWYNSANVAYRLGHPFSVDEAFAVKGTDGRLVEVLADLERHLGAQGIPIDSNTFRMSNFLELDSEKQCFTGEYAEKANALMNISYRKPFAVPEIS